MSTKAIREALGALLAESARANDFAGRDRVPSESERTLYRAALAEVEAIEKAGRYGYLMMVGDIHMATREEMGAGADVFEAIYRKTNEEKGE